MRVLWSSRAVLTAVAAFMVGLPSSLSRGQRTVLTATIISFLVGHRQYPKELHSPGHGQVIAHFVRSVEASTLMAKANASLFSQLTVAQHRERHPATDRTEEYKLCYIAKCGAIILFRTLK